MKVSLGGILSWSASNTTDHANTTYGCPRSPWENGYIESFNVWLRDHLLAGEIFSAARRPDSLYGRPTAGRLP